MSLLGIYLGQPMDGAGVQGQTVISSTHQYPDGTMTALLRRAATQSWPLYTWCWQETLEPNGWLTQAQVDRKRGELSGEMWRIEFDLQESWHRTVADHGPKRLGGTSPLPQSDLGERRHRVAGCGRSAGRREGAVGEQHR